MISRSGWISIGTCVFQGEIKMVVSIEDEANRELPTSMDLYRPIRQTVYSVLLNLNKLKIIHDNQNKEKSKRLFCS